MESLTVAETETEDDSAYIDIEGKLQSLQNLPTILSKIACLYTIHIL